MRLLFLAPFLTGLISAYIARKSQDEMAYLTGAVAAVSLLISLMLAPWQVQLLLLILALSTVGYIWRQSWRENTLEIQEIESTAFPRPDKKLTPSTLKIVPTEDAPKGRVRKYRGVVIEETPSQPAVNPSVQNLRYRGADVPHILKSNTNLEQK